MSHSRSASAAPVSRSASITASSVAAARAARYSVSSKCATLPHHHQLQAAPPSEQPLGSLAFTPEELSSQLTHLDLPVFTSIQPEELTSCSWNKKNKLEVAPNVVAFIKRFNHVSFWAVQEILRSESPKQRAEVMCHLVRTAKKLHELNNLNSEFAVISALQSAAVFRLTKTWSYLPKKERQTFDKLADLFSDNDNFARLREHMNGTALKHHPCVPYLGLYLTDLVYIDMAHPHSGGMESQQRRFKMNNILRIVSELQQSSYAHVPIHPFCQQYLRSIQYIDELQKFIEEDNYKLSLRLEPNSIPSSVPSSSSSKESVQSSRDPNLMAELNLSPAKGNGAIRGSKTSSSSSSTFVPGHRKSRSDGASIFLSCGGSSTADDLQSWSNSGTLSSAESDERFRQHHLLDDSLLDDPFLPSAGVSSSSSAADQVAGANSNDVSVYKCVSDKVKLTEGEGRELLSSPTEMPMGTTCTFQGCVKRKTLIKQGRRPAVSTWQRYWLQIWGSSLVFFLPKKLTKGLDRRDFRTDPAKFKSIAGWLVMVGDSTDDNLSFQLTDPVQKDVYRFRAPTPELARTWVQCLSLSSRGRSEKSLPTNLISFE